MKTIPEMTEELINKFQTKTFDVGTVVISCNFCIQGGNFLIYDLQKVLPEEKGIVDFDVVNSVYKDLIAKDMGFLIEPSNYTTEPFDRQQPFYFPYRYSNLNKKEHGKFNLYMFKKGGKDQSTSTRLDRYFYNDFWNKISFDMLIEKGKLIEFVSEFLELYQMSNMQNDIVNYLNS